MKARRLTRLVPVALAMSLATALAGCAAPAPKPLPATALQPDRVAPTSDQTAALARFGQRLFNQVVAGGELNPVISPLSAFFALGMVGDGAQGATADAFQQVLGVSAEQARAIAADLLADLGSLGGGTSLNLADSAWLDNSLQVEQDWVDRLKAYYQAEVFATDLGPAAVPAVNAWIKDKTNGLIPQMLQTIDPATVALLIDALYLKAAWATPFRPSDTTTGDFTTAQGDTVSADYLRPALGATVKLIDDAAAQGVVLPYADGRLAFLAVMPTSGRLSLDDDSIANWLAAAHESHDVVFSMPKFHAEFATSLKDGLAALGLTAAFSPDTAELAGIGSSPQGPLYIGDVLQNVSLSVGEEGTQAAAATAVIVLAGAAQVKYVIFDHPYLYAIVDQTTGLPLFIGAMDDPSAAPPDVH